MYCPYIASAMLQHNDTDYFNVHGMYVNDGVIGSGPYTDISMNYFAQNWHQIVPLADGAMELIANRSAECGWDDFMDTYLTYPGTAQPLDTKIFANYS
jgi:carboxypeptidase D